MRLSLDVAAHQEFAPGAWVPTVDIGDPVDLRLQASLGEFVYQPVAGCDVLRGQGGAVDAGFVLADASQFMKVAEQSVAGNLGHGLEDLWLLVRLAAACQMQSGK